MDWSDTPEQAAFRDEVRDFIARSLPARYQRLAAQGRDPGWRGGWRSDRVSEDEAVRSAAVAWADALRERAWVAPHWPTEYGGAGMTSMEQFVPAASNLRAHSESEVGAPVVTGGPHAAAISESSERQRAAKSRRCSARGSESPRPRRQRKYCRNSSNAEQKRAADAKLPKPRIG